MFEFSVKDRIDALMEREIDKAERAATSGIKAAGVGLKGAWRAQVVGAGLGRRLGNAVRNRTYPGTGRSLQAASVTYSQAPEIMDAHDRGALIQSARGLYLAIPIAEVAKMRGPGNKRITPDGWERKTGRELKFIFRRGAPSLLVDVGKKSFRARNDPLTWNKKRRAKQRGARKTVPIFILVPFAKLRQKLDLDRDVKIWGDSLPGLIVNRWK